MKGFLVDTNIFLEILLNQSSKEDCKAFLREKTRMLCISDFSLHSIGVVLFRNKAEDVFKIFAEDVLPHVSVISLSMEKYSDIPEIAEKYGLDFDDSYQTFIADDNDLIVVTMDADFKKVTDLIEIQFII